MKNIITKISAADVAKIVENHLNTTMLDKSKRAKATTIFSMTDPTCEPNQPNTELTVTFDVVDTAS